MRRRIRTTLLTAFLFIFLFAFLHLHLSRNAISGDHIRFIQADLATRSKNPKPLNLAIREDLEELELNIRTRHVSSIKDPVGAVSVLLPDWLVLVVASPDTAISGRQYFCVFQNNATSPASFAGVLPFTNRTTFKCILPNRVRRRLPFLQPVLTRFPQKEWPEKDAPEMIRWKYLAYESLSTENDVVLFVKGVNHRQGLNRPPEELRCVFGDDAIGAVKTAVTSSVQEVFRCLHPEFPGVSYSGGNEPIRVSLEIPNENRIVPSVAYYTPWRKLPTRRNKSLLCACTMVYNAAKFLKEWVMYHSKIGVEKFILYDNDSDDDLENVVKELNEDGFNVETLFWIWPKTQEAGFSHSAIHAKDSCTWTMYVDVDEFVFAPKWLNSLQPSNQILKSFLPRSQKSESWVGQVSISCNEFGPSNQRSHPIEGVTQGYTCRRRLEQRHKSIVLLDAVEDSLLNVIHHFELKENYRMEHLSMEDAVVNHYKYQAWSEFKSKFRRRVSAYVVDWTQEVNPMSKDRAPGLGFEPIEPEGWSDKFCEVTDDRLKLLTRRWFGVNDTPSGYKMVWQR